MKQLTKVLTLTGASLVSAVALGSTLTLSSNNSVQAQQTDAPFSCQERQGIPTTIVRTKQGAKEFIQWDSLYFKPSGYPPQVRCNHVTARLNQFSQVKSEQFITDGMMNGQPVICLTDSEGGPCQGLLYTLKPGQSGETALTLLIRQTESNFNQPPLREGPCHTYLNINSVIEGKPEAKKICS